MRIERYNIRRSGYSSSRFISSHILPTEGEEERESVVVDAVVTLTIFVIIIDNGL
jgi:hypothetical protein